MTLRRKILGLILLLTGMIILAMSATYYFLFIKQVQEQSYNQVTMAFDFIFDDIENRVRNFASKSEVFVRSSLTGPMYVLQLLQEQYSQSEQPWTVRDIRKVMTHLSAMTNEIVKFGDVIDATEILVYDKSRTLNSIYYHTDKENIVGAYLPTIYAREVIPLQPGDEWYITLKEIQDIPRKEFPEEIATTYQEELPENMDQMLSTLDDLVTIKFIVPILQRGEIGGVCVIQVGLRQSDVERYSLLSQTKVNVFAGKTLSIGSLPEYHVISEDILQTAQSVELSNIPDVLPITFSEMTVAGQQYYQGTLILSNEEKLLGAITAHFPRSLEEQRRNEFIVLVLGITILFGIVAATSASVMSSFVARPIMKLTHLLQRLTEGDIEGIERLSFERIKPARLKPPQFSQDPEEKELHTKDELNLLFLSFHAMVRYLREMATVADRISRGEISQEVRPRSEKDVLGNAFHRMTTYLKAIASVATTVASGDLRQQIEARTEQDILGQAFHQMESLRQIMSLIMNEAQNLRKASEELNQISSQMASDAIQASQGTKDVSSNSERVSSHVNEVATATQQLAATVREISRTVNEVAKTVNDAVATANSTNTTIANLETRSQEIGDIIKVIAAITKQTNLLALNATIEAARAGEMGKGFAVVAGEVKDLSREIAKSAEDITKKVEAIQSSSKGATEAISEMAKNINQIYGFTNTVATAVKEQMMTTEVITHNLADAAEGSGEVSHAIADIAAVAHNTSEIAMTVQNAAKRLASSAEHLQELVNKFKI